MARISDTLKDVLKHTHGLGIFEMVKIKGVDDKTTIETVDADKTVIVKGESVNQVPDFVDATVGLSRMPTLDAFLKLYNENDGATISVVSQDRNGEDVPTEVSFKGGNGSTSNYRFMLADVINQQLKDITFKGAEFEINFAPSKENYDELNAHFGALGSFENSFSPKTEDGDLYFYIGDGGSDRSKVKVASGVEGEITHDFKWPLDIVLKIMKLGDHGNILLSINNKGLLQLYVDSGLGKYTYLLPNRA